MPINQNSTEDMWSSFRFMQRQQMNRFYFGATGFERPDTPMTAKDCPVDSWKTSEGKKIKIVKLETPHLASIVALLLRNEKDGKKNPQRSKIISLKKELVKRLSE